MIDDEQRTQVKIWETDSTHESFEKADVRRKSLEEEGSAKEVKLRQCARGFMVKIWHGQTRGAPPPKKKKDEGILTL